MLPQAKPAKVLYLTAGSGITPVMGMLRDTEFDDVVMVHCAPQPQDVIFRNELHDLVADRKLRLTEVHTDTDGMLDIARLDELVPDWAERETWACGPAGLLDAAEQHWTEHGVPERLHTERFRPSIVVAGDGGEVTFSATGKTVDADGATPLLDVGEEAGVLMPSGCRMGICFGCVTPLQGGRRPRPAHRRDHRGRAGRPHPDLRVRRGGPLRHRHGRSTLTAIDPDRPPDRGADRGARPRAGRDPRRGDRRPRREGRRLHPQGHHGQRKLELVSRGVLLFSIFPPAWLVGTAGLSVAKIMENMEIGHNVMHGQWDWMRDPKIHSTTWEWDNASPAEQWKHSHNELHHTYTNVIGKDNDLGYGIMRVDEDQKWQPFYLGQPLWNFINACFFEYGIAAYDLELGKNLHKRRRKDPEFRARAKAVGRKIRKQVTQGLRRSTRCCRARRSSPRSPPTFTANLVRNIWSHSVIMCGHFPEGVQTFEKPLDRGRDARRVVPAPDAGLGQHQRQQGRCTS